jgi:V8-like Glu-specific endopeptidase
VLAGLDALAPRIDVSGSPPEAVTRIVHHLTAYGHVPTGPHALGRFLNLVGGFVGEEEQAVLADVLTRYDLMTPVARAPGIDTWRGATTDLTENVSRGNTSHPVAFLSAAVAVARCVAYVGVTSGAQSWSGTGFLVGPDLLLTNNHVLPRADLALRTVFRFNFQDDADGRPERHDDYTGAPGGVFHTSKDMDYTLVQLTGRPGHRWGYLPLGAETPAVGDRVNTVQHPGGQPKQIAMRDNVVEYVGGGVVQYVTSTLPGSSGAPVLTDEWRVCAVHHASGSVREPTTSRTFFRNEGVMVSAILRDLPGTVRSVLPVGGVAPA